MKEADLNIIDYNLTPEDDLLLSKFIKMKMCVHGNIQFKPEQVEIYIHTTFK